MALPAQAFDFNLINVDLGSNEGQKLTQSYGKSYGYTPQQTAPAMLGPAQEVPMIMQIAKSASTVPMTVWMMRRMGMSVPKILSTFALGPSALMGGGMGSPSPYNSFTQWNNFTNPYLIQSSRVNYLTKILRVPMQFIPDLPYGGSQFSRSLVYPYHPVHGTWMPPGIAKKHGLWVPPGQRKKVGWYGDWGKHHGKHYDKHHGKHHDKHHDKYYGKEGKHGRKGHDGDWKSKSKGKSSHGGGSYLASKPEKSYKKSKSKGSTSWKGGGSSKGKGGGKGKWK